jgi:hypothetical protein
MTWPGSPREREREANRRFNAKLRGSQVMSFTYDDLRLKRAYWGSRCYLCGEITDGFDHVRYRRVVFSSSQALWRAPLRGAHGSSS